MSAEIIIENELERLKKFDKDLEWFRNNYKELKQEYKGEYVAIKDEKVVDHNRDVQTLLARLREIYNDDTSSVVVEHINEYRYIYAM